MNMDKFIEFCKKEAIKYIFRATGKDIDIESIEIIRSKFIGNIIEVIFFADDGIYQFTRWDNGEVDMVLFKCDGILEIRSGLAKPNNDNEKTEKQSNTKGCHLATKVSPMIFENDKKNTPDYYKLNGKDTMSIILEICENNKTDTTETAYLFNALKYLIRFKNKNGLQDLQKAKDYLNRLIDYETIENLPFYNVDKQGD